MTCWRTTTTTTITTTTINNNSRLLHLLCEPVDEMAPSRRGAERGYEVRAKLLRLERSEDEAGSRIYSDVVDVGGRLDRGERGAGAVVLGRPHLRTGASRVTSTALSSGASSAIGRCAYAIPYAIGWGAP